MNKHIEKAKFWLGVAVFMVAWCVYLPLSLFIHDIEEEQYDEEDDK